MRLKRYFKNLLLLFFGLFSQTILAAINADSLVKVTGENNPNCVEYYTYKQELYCTTKSQNSKPADPRIKDYETQNIVFDDRPWKIAWGKKTPTITTVEYIPQGDDIDHWNELVTSQFIPSIPDHVTPKQFAQMMITNLQQSGLKPISNIILEKPNQVIFEFRLEAPENLKQDELQKITKTPNGFYILHYAIKQPNMSDENRQKWLENLKNSSIK